MKILLTAKNLNDSIGPTGQLVRTVATSTAFSKNDLFFYSEKKESRIMHFLKKQIGKIYHFFTRNPANMWDYKIIARKILRVAKKEKVDVVFVAAGSFNYFRALYYLNKKHNIDYILYYADIFATVNSDNKALEIEKEWINSSILCVENNSHKKLFFSKFENNEKVIFIEWPSIFSQSRAFTQNNTDSKIRFAYIGSFYYPHRGAQDLMQLIEQLCSMSFDFSFYLIGTNITDFIKQEDINDHVELIERMKPDDLFIKLQSMDFLINIENADPNWLPSKLVQYLMCNKPIINVGGKEETVSKGYLKEYSGCFLNYNNSLSVDDLNNFIQNNKHHTILNNKLSCFDKEIIGETIINEYNHRK